MLPLALALFVVPPSTTTITTTQAQVLAEAMPARIGLTLAHGDSVRHAMTIVNRGSGAIDVHVRYSDWTMDERGALRLVPAGKEGASLHGLVAFTPSSFTVAPGDTARVQLTLRMPSHGPATRWGVMLSEVRPAGAPDHPGRGAALGTTLYLSSLPPSDIHPEIDAIDVVPYGPDSLGVRVRLKNAGGRHYHAATEVSIRDLDGATLGGGKLPAAVVLPQFTRDATWACRLPLAPGRYRATVALDAGLPHRIEAEVAFDWPPAPSAQLEKRR